MIFDFNNFQVLARKCYFLGYCQRINEGIGGCRGHDRMVVGFITTVKPVYSDR